MKQFISFCAFLLLFGLLSTSLYADTIRKELLYKQHTLENQYSYNKTPREFQWTKIQRMLTMIDSLQQQTAVWGVFQNKKNINGMAPLIPNAQKDKYDNYVDTFGVTRVESAPLFNSCPSSIPQRYGRDGLLVRLLGDTCEKVRLSLLNDTGVWWTPPEYVKFIGDYMFKKVIVVDRTNQNIATLEKLDAGWTVRSMNPATTGVHRPPHKRETPLGIFVVQAKVKKMRYLKDGTTELEGSAPYASRFTCGAYIHGVPVDLPSEEIVEFSWSLGTTPRSHMCVRNATSHALFVYDWAPVEEALVFVIE